MDLPGGDRSPRGLSSAADAGTLCLTVSRRVQREYIYKCKWASNILTRTISKSLIIGGEHKNIAIDLVKKAYRTLRWL